MPFKCTNCDKVVQSTNDMECSCNNPHFIKCVTMHYIHVDGSYRVYASGRRIVGIPTKEGVQIAENVTLKLCCDTQDQPTRATSLKSMVTCAKCLSFISPPISEDIT